MFRSFGRFSRRLLWIALLLLSVAGDGARGQWRIVGPNALLPEHDDISGGSIHFKDGVLWAGYNNLVFSLDSGRTWQPSNFPKNVLIFDIAFLNKDTGALAGGGNVWVTTDGGKTWDMTGEPADLSIAFLSDSELYSLPMESIPTMNRSKDCGKSWITGGSLPASARIFTSGKNRVLYALLYNAAVRKWPGRLALSRDSANSWTSTSGAVEVDTYSIAVDSCDDSRLYLANEDWVFREEPESHLYVSSDAGASWVTSYSARIPYLGGSICSSRNAQFAGTINNGILRSTDHGLTWVNIGGPGNEADSRGICAISDNLIIALDSNGNIWETTNSGGDSLLNTNSGDGIFSVSPRTLFMADTLICGDSAIEVASIRLTACKTQLKQVSISGEDSSNYEFTFLGKDSIRVAFHPTSEGAKNGYLRVAFTDGTFADVTLRGVMRGNNFLSVTTANQMTKILGGSVEVPISISGLAQPEDVNLILHYDSSLIYRGSYDPANVPTDIPGGQWPGRTIIHIIQAQSGVVAGYSHFDVFADSNSSPQVTFDSLTIFTPDSPCGYTLPAPATSTITRPVGCGTSILSQFLETGNVPVFSVRPNPATGDVWVSSSEDLGDVNLSVFDVLGAERGTDVVTLGKGSPVRLSLPEGDGVYRIVVRSVVGAYTLKVVRQR